MKTAIITSISVLSCLIFLTGCPHDDKIVTPPPGGTNNDPKYGYILINYKDVYAPQSLFVDNTDQTANLVYDQSSDYCSDPNFASKKIKLKTGTAHDITSGNGLVQWNISNINVDENECKVITLSKTNITSQANSQVWFNTNYESGMRDVHVYLDGAEVGTIPEIKNINPVNPDPTPTITKDIEPGTHSYFAVSDNNQKWSGTFTIENGNVSNVGFQRFNALPIAGDSCSITFTSPSYNRVSVYLNNTYIGQSLSSYAANTADMCERKWNVSIVEPLGTYFYTATDASGKNWSGTVNANANGGCVVIALQ